MGAELKRAFNSPNTLSAAEDHWNGALWEVRDVRGAATEL